MAERGTEGFGHSPTGWISPDGAVYGPARAEHWWTLRELAGYYGGMQQALDEGWIRYAFYGPGWMSIEGGLDSLERNKHKLEDLGYRYLVIDPSDQYHPQGTGKIDVDVRFPGVVAIEGMLPGEPVRHTEGFQVTFPEFVENSISYNLRRAQMSRRLHAPRRPDCGCQHVGAYRRSR